MNNNHFKFLCMQFCEKNKGKTFGEVIQNISFDVRDYVIRLEDCYFRYSYYYTEFRIFSYSIFVCCCSVVYFENLDHNEWYINLANIVGEMNDII